MLAQGTGSAICVKKITIATAIHSIAFYFSHTKPAGSHLRLGQYLVNEHDLKTETHEDTRELFYTKDDKRAIILLFERFVDGQ